MTAPATGPVRRRLTVRGTVQGVGFRPHVHRLAAGLSLAGFVGNIGDGVLIEVEGPAGEVDRFCALLAEQPPPLAAVTAVAGEDLPATGESGTFTIRTTERSPGRTQLPPDTATCADCLSELSDPADRRHRHPFITCTHCGPRFTVATGMPYDRAVTTMAGFPMCPPCAREYGDPADRRFHAQPVACPDCGPRLALTPAAGSGARPARDGEAIATARALLAAGRIVAVKGVGGYHLACDATDTRAVGALRDRKERGGKAFAVMCADLTTAERIALLSDAERAALTSARRPIVLLRRRTPPDGLRLAEQVCPGSPHLGVLLPYTPVHTLLFGLPGDPPGPRALVMTSGNRSGEPIVTDDTEALTRLAGLADAWLTHDRPIASPCDDSLLRVRPDGTEQVVRRSRGYVPRPLRLPVPVRPTLAAGGDLKNVLCLGEGEHAWFGPHIGDMGELATLEAADRAERHLARLTGVTPRLVAADRHPGYHSTARARRSASRLGAGAPVLVQHHHAHVASAMAEHGLDGTTPVIGVAFDGTGYGDDRTVWGGEILLADYTGYRRFAHLTPAPLPGGDAGVANPCRLALARLWAAGLPWTPALPSVMACSDVEKAVLRKQLERQAACVPTSSMGRLFDAVSSLVGVCHRAEYEAQAAMELEAAALEAAGDDAVAHPFGFGTRGEIDPAPALAALLDDQSRGTPAAVLAARFHRGVARAVTEICRRARTATGLTTVALTGGVFVNALLEEECTALLTREDFTVLRHGDVPPNDGGLALGQLMVAGTATNHETE
ncbi:hydrogenase maturation protein HypF [Streptomyces sp. 1222.5]|uniref:carbamoyltransferase HypF n=1 Tax=unclassified Streptomyces TaxID=2593676 RepID=UPI00089533D2|nr:MULTISPECIES: carbamoyltransferase HypF [unclassified Streptomyces]PKW05713.1 hydrogenase maturation protein HypF [Streptomyces sp. 5112.2]SED30928.1 hydrogenase maturation protein HypF [Streptomyces sp. 1222.5]